MRPNILLLGLLVAVIQPLAVNAADQHVIAQADNMKWGPAPPALPKGAQMAVIAGDPGKEGPYVLRLKMPAGFKVPAHTHPMDENVTVISGSFHIGMGAKLDESKGDFLKAGGFTAIGKGMQHYAWFTEESVIQLHGDGPVVINYVNPADDPRKGN